jgi:plastocyanin
MKRPALVAVCLCLIAAAPASSAEESPDRVMARGSEFNIVLSKPKVTPGRVIVQFVNDGEDPHDVMLQRVGGKTQIGSGVVPPGGVIDLDRRLRKRSTYMLWCSLADHRALGMEAQLRTRKRG